MRWIGRGILAVVVSAILALSFYTLPQRDIVLITGTEIIRQHAARECVAGITNIPMAEVSINLVSDQQSLSLGDVFSFDIELNSPENEALQDIYGIAFTLEFNVPFSENPSFDLSNSWLGTPEENLANFSFGDIRNDKCTRMAIVRLDQETVSSEDNVRLLGSRTIIG